MDVTKEDIAGVHSRIDSLVEVNTNIQVSIGKIQQHLKDLVIPSQPCQHIKEHIKDHKETLSLWQKPFIRAVFDLVKMGIVAVITWLFVRK